VEEETEVKRQEHKDEQTKLAAQRKAEAEARKKKAEEDAAAAAQKAADDAAAQAEAGAAGQEGEVAAPQEVGWCFGVGVCWETYLDVVAGCVILFTDV
jgi:colicin import membrane protein